MLYKHILGGVALAATGYGLSRYFKDGGFFEVNKNEIYKNPMTRREAVKEVAEFCYQCGEMCYALNELQEYFYFA